MLKEMNFWSEVLLHQQLASTTSDPGENFLHQQLWSWRNKLFRTFVLQDRKLIENTVQAFMMAFHNTKVLSSCWFDCGAGPSKAAPTQIQQGVWLPYMLWCGIWDILFSDFEQQLIDEIRSRKHPILLETGWFLLLTLAIRCRKNLKNSLHTRNLRTYSASTNLRTGADSSKPRTDAAYCSSI